MEMAGAEREIDDVGNIVGMRTEEHSLRSQVGIGSDSDCLLGQLKRIRFRCRPKSGEIRR